MKGLFLNNFYEAWSNLRIAILLILLFGVAVIYTGNSTLLEVFPYITISMFSVSGISSLRKDATSQWSRYELTLPVKRTGLMGSKYINYLFWVFGGLLVSAVVVFTAYALHTNLHNYIVRDFSSLFSLGVGLAVLDGAIFFPLYIIFGADKSETLLVVSVILSLALAISGINLVNMFDLSNTIRLAIFNLAHVILYGLSYLVSVKLYTKRDF